MGITLRALLEALHGIHVLGAYEKHLFLQIEVPCWASCLRHPGSCVHTQGPSLFDIEPKVSKQVSPVRPRYTL